MHAELYDFFRAAFSASQFRRWVGRLSPDGRALAQALPEGHVDALALFFKGADVLISQNYIDAAFFTALAREFPKRHAELAKLAATCHVHWIPPKRWDHPPPPPPALSRPGLAITLCLGAALAQLLVNAVPDGVCPAMEVVPETTPVDMDSACFTSTIAVPNTSIIAATTTDRGGTSGGEAVDLTKTIKPAQGPKPPNSGKTESRRDDSGSVPDVPPPDLPPPEPRPCTTFEPLRTKLQALARDTLSGPGLSKEFTVTLQSGSAKPNVSPAPKAGDAAGRQLYDHLRSLSPAALGHCRDRPIDIVFSSYKTTVDLRE
ncbi:MAG: hypothetical protein H0T76_24980 [Nannocystis sp.]|nr:hypothetical protein [Nannocystis sp.]MBA3549747.1 hypothetical protein [Nannocystis sp.]